MPDHMHGIIEIKKNKNKNKNDINEFKSPSETIGSIIRGFKIASIKKIKDLVFVGANCNLTVGANCNRIVGANCNSPRLFEIIKKIESINFKIWQRNYYEHIIRDEAAFYRISEYIRKNPEKFK